MMKKLILIFSFLIPVMIGKTQRERDSLMNALIRHYATDSLRFSTWCLLSREITDDPDQSLAYADSALQLSKKLNDKNKSAEAFYHYANAWSANGNDDSAMINFNNALSLMNNKSSELAGKIFHAMGISSFNQSRYRQAISYHQKALTIFQTLHKKAGSANCLNSLGINYMWLSDYTSALNNYLQALKIFQELKEPAETAMLNMNIGILFHKLKDFKKSLSNLQMATEYHKTSGNKVYLAQCFNNTGNVYMDMKKYNVAIGYYRNALELYRQSKNEYGIASEFLNLGTLYFNLQKYDSSWIYLHQSVPLYKKLGDIDDLAMAYEYFGEILLKAPSSFFSKFNLSYQHRYKKAEENLKYSLTLFEKSEDLEGQSDVLISLSLLHEKQNRIKDALAEFKQGMEIHDSIINLDKKEEIVRAEEKFEYDKKELLLNAGHQKQQALAQVEIKRQTIIKNSALGGAGILLFSGAFTFLFYKKRRDAEKQKLDSDLKAEISDVEMKALRSQMNPHFIFNSLNSISEFVLHNDVRSADNYLSKFAKLMRITLENSMQKEVALTDDLQALEYYMQLEALRLKHKFDFEINVDSAIDKENTLIPPMILQPFVENSIWHGIAKKEGIGKIKIRVSREGNMLKCVVEDDGIGRSFTKSKEERKSLGMKITNERIQLINKLKKSKAAIVLTDLAQGLQVEVTLPLETNF